MTIATVAARAAAAVVAALTLETVGDASVDGLYITRGRVDVVRYLHLGRRCIAREQVGRRGSVGVVGPSRVRARRGRR